VHRPCYQGKSNMSQYFFFVQLPCYYLTLYKWLLCLYQSLYFLKIYKSIMYAPSVSGINVDPTSQVHQPCWYYRLKDVKKFAFWVGPNGIMPVPKFHLHPSSSSETESCGQTQPAMTACYAWIMRTVTLVMLLGDFWAYEWDNRMLFLIVCVLCINDLKRCHC
jgi:hypothetical protein